MKRFLAFIIGSHIVIASLPLQSKEKQWLASPSMAGLFVDLDHVITRRKDIRTLMRKQLKSPEHKNLRMARSEVIMQKLQDLKRYQEARVIGFYYPLQWEADITDLIKTALRNGKTVALPLCHADKDIREMEFYQIHSLSDLKPGAFGIMEPDPLRAVLIDPACLDVLLFSGMAFDTQCNRLGYGYGYSESYGTKLRSYTVQIGLCFSFQLIDAVPVMPGDVRVEWVVTDGEIINRNMKRLSPAFGKKPVQDLSL